jgi:murein DD-endopeptidase MepM/ murein hydrolase activator NlpD
MLGFVRGLVLGLVLFAAGWFCGSIYPAPASLTQPIAQRVPNLAQRLGISEVTLERLSRFLSNEQLARLRHDASELAARAGEAIVVEHSGDAVEMQSEAAIAAPAPASMPAGAAAFEDHLSLCPHMAVAAAPPADASGRIRNFAKRVNVNGVALAIAPTHGACLSSSFGYRDGRLHKGIDLYSPNGGPILAAADGVVIERKYRDDYGNMLLIDHGHGVYTRYAHLSSFASDDVVGARVHAGQLLGLMGNTASYQIPVHLHYELLLGDYNNPRGAFGLTPRSIFDYPAAG